MSAYWIEDFEQAGYAWAHLSSASSWTQVHAWCMSHVGKSHYVWFGNTFFFVHESDATEFSLVWG
jgi:hypothetical protein